MGSSMRPRVVIVGGGAGGLELAIRLSRLRRRPRIDVTLIDRRETHVWKPLLHEIASGSIYPSSNEVSFRAVARWHGFTFCQGAFEALDRNERVVHVAAVSDEDGIIIPARRIAYDVVVLALGSMANDFGVPGVTGHTFKLDDADEAARFHRRIVNTCLRANYLPESQGRGQIDIVIVGGGATGVELAAELRATTRLLTDYGLDNVEAERFVRITLLNADQRLLQQLPERISKAITEVLGGLGVKVLNSEQVVEVGRRYVITKSGERFHSDLTVWAAGVKAPELLKDIAGLETNRLNQIVVSNTLTSTRDPFVLAMGDCAAAPWVGKDRTVPPRAQAAQQEAIYLTRAIPRLLEGKPLRPFRYNDLGSLVSLGEATTIGTLMGFATGHSLRVEGYIARAIYRWLYKRHQSVLFGWGAVVLDTIGERLRGATRPRIKLH
jgi:NADH dehydrogenase